MSWPCCCPCGRAARYGAEAPPAHRRRDEVGRGTGLPDRQPDRRRHRGRRFRSARIRYGTCRHFHMGRFAGAVEAVKVSSAWVGTKLCFEFMVLTAVRPGEARGARWEEIDFGASVWTIPATRMKTTREHRVPLCARAVEVLNAAARLRKGSTTAQSAGLVFPSGARQAARRREAVEAARAVGDPGRAARLPFVFRDWASERTITPGGGGGCARARRPQPD